MRDKIENQAKNGQNREEFINYVHEPLYITRKRIIMWLGVTIFTVIMLFLWASTLKSNLGEFFAQNQASNLEMDMSQQLNEFTQTVGQVKNIIAEQANASSSENVITEKELDLIAEKVAEKIKDDQEQ